MKKKRENIELAENKDINTWKMEIFLNCPVRIGFFYSFKVNTIALLGRILFSWKILETIFIRVRCVMGEYH